MNLDQIQFSAIDPCLLRIYLDKMPPGRYHRRDDAPWALFRDGVMVCEISRRGAEPVDGLVAALVHILNTRKP